MSINPNTKMLLKHTSVLFVVFLLCVALLISTSYLIGETDGNWENFASITLMLLLEPAIIIRQWLFEIPGADLAYHYYFAMGPVDLISLIIFYYLVCFVGVWVFALIKSRNSQLRQ